MAGPAERDPDPLINKYTSIANTSSKNTLARNSVDGRDMCQFFRKKTRR
jgi:hypothetical protein